MTLPPIGHFQDPELTEPTPPTIEGDRIFGHLCTFDQSHVGLPGQHVKPPRSRTGYGEFHRRPMEVLGDDGKPTTIKHGVLTYNTSHAPLSATSRQSDRHMDHSGSIAAKVCAGEDDIGVWISGQLAPDMSEADKFRITACALSGEWRPDDGQPPAYPDVELRHALFVPFEGFPIMRGQLVASGGLTADGDVRDSYVLVAAGALIPRGIDPDRIVVTIAPPTEETPVTASADTTEKPSEEAPVTETDTTSEAVTASADAPKPIVTDQVVRVSGDLPPALVASVDSDAGTALVQIELPVSQLEDAGKEGVALLASAQRERLREKETEGLKSDLSELREQMSTLVASVNQDREDRKANPDSDAKLADIFAEDAEA